MIKHILTSSLIIISCAAAITISSHAAFVDTATVSGINFSTGRAELKIFGNIGFTNPGNNGNLTHKLYGPSFEGIGPDWEDSYALKYMNTGTVALDTTLRAVIKEDASDLADDVMVKVWLWHDVNGNGSVNKSGPDTLTDLGPAVSLESLVATPLHLSATNPSSIRGLYFEFTTGDLPAETQNQYLKLDLLIDGATTSAP